MKVRTKIVLVKDSYDGKHTEVLRTVHDIMPIYGNGLLIGYFKLNGIYRYAMSTEGSYVWTEIGKRCAPVTAYINGIGK